MRRLFRELFLAAVALVSVVASPSIKGQEVQDRLTPSIAFEAQSSGAVQIVEATTPVMSIQSQAPADTNPSLLRVEDFVGPMRGQQSLMAAVRPITVGEQVLTEGTAVAYRSDLAATNATPYTWAATGFYHHPLYFEQVNLERHGMGTYRILQPATSAAHFFATIPVIPLKLGSQLPCEKVYTLGHYRSGDCVPYRYHADPITWRGVAFQGMATTGFIFVLP